MLTAGITAGFFIFERMRIASGSFVMAVSGALIYMACRELADGGKVNRSVGREAEICAAKLIAVMIAGFLIFTMRFIHYETALKGLQDPDDQVLQGLAESVSESEKGIKLVMMPDGASCKVRVSLYSDDPPEAADIIGRHISAYGSFKEVPAADNPGCFDCRTYMRSKGIGCFFTARSLEISSDAEDGSEWINESGDRGDRTDSVQERRVIASARNRLKRYLFGLRENFLKEIEDDAIRAFIKGVVFGDKSDLDQEMRDDFNFNGTGHILAVSGLHTGFLYALLRLLSGKRKMLPVSLFIIGILFLYGEMTMWSPSVTRAVTVLSISLMAVYAKRPFDLLSAASAAAFIMLVREPYQLFSSGFQMSFMALMGMAFLTGPLTPFIGETAAAMTSVQLGTAPLTAYLYHRFNILSVFINIPVIFLASLLVPVCITALFFTAAAGRCVRHIIFLIEGLSELIIRINETASAGGFFSNQVTACGVGILTAFYLIIFMSSSEWMRVAILRREFRKISIALLCLAAVSFCAGIAGFNEFADDEVVFVSVGQGDCVHIRSGDKNALIDGGGNTERNVGKETLMPYLLGNGAERIETAMVTHLHTDHALGILQLSCDYPVGSISIPEDYRRSIEKIRTEAAAKNDENTGNVITDKMQKQSDQPDISDYLRSADNLRYLSSGSRISVSDDVFIDAIWPLRSGSSGIDIDDANELNTVYMITYKGIRIMVTGDLLEEDELEMVRHYRGTDILKCDILKVAHHGSKSSSSEAFLDAASPSIAVIQVGKNNLYGHPHDQTLDRLAERGIKVFRTDINGAAGIDIRHKGIKVDLIRQEPKHH